MKMTDCHTHRLPADPSDSLFSQMKPEMPPDGVFFSAGVHPMFADSSSIPLPFFELFRSERCRAIGECGLDRRSPLPLDQQEVLFLRHADAAEELGKPLVIHAVRTRQEMMRLRKKRQPSVPWIIHGCRGAVPRLREWADAGFLLSFGDALLRADEPMEEFFRSLPDDVILMETDESDVPLEVLYSVAAACRRMNREDFTAMIEHNYRRIFFHES